MQFLRTIIISILISLSSSYIIMSLNIYFSSNGVMTGRDLIEEVMIAIVLGLTIGVISLIFEMERISFLVQLISHFSMITICVFIAGYIGNWYDIAKVSTVIIVFVSVIIIYGMTWWLFHVLLKKDVDEINKTIQKRRGEIK